MRARTIIRLGSEPDQPVQWLSLDAEGRPQGTVHNGTLADAAEATGGRPAIALLPGFDVLLLSARIPTQSRQKQMRALPFVLEDQLAEDVEDLHFVPGARENGALSVAVIDKARLREWLDACKSAGIELTRTQPETLALPRGADEWTVLIEDASFLVRTGTHAGFAGDRTNLLPLLEAALAEAEQRPARLRVFGTAPELDALDIERDIDAAVVPLSLMAATATRRDALNLQTGEFGTKHNLATHWRRWQLVAALLLAWVVIDTGAAYVERWQYQRELDTLQAEIDTLYRDAFGSRAPALHALRGTVENRLNAMRGGGNGDTLLDMLHRIGPILNAQEDIELSALSFRNGEIDLEFSTGDVQTVDRLKQRIDEVNGLAAEVRGARSGDERVQGRLRIGAS